MNKKEIDRSVINKALKKYINKKANYIKNAELEKINDNHFIIDAEFSINDSCYISPSSGHFNAVEALICFAQIFFAGIFSMINNEITDFYDHIDMDIFENHKHEVPILEIHKMKFTKEINPKRFYGRLELKKRKSIMGKIHFDCHISYGQEKGKAEQSGLIKLLIPSLQQYA